MTEHNEQHQHEAEEAAAVETSPKPLKPNRSNRLTKNFRRVSPSWKVSSKTANCAVWQMSKTCAAAISRKSLTPINSPDKKFAAEMLPVKDYLEMALLDQSGNFDALKMGVQMTLNELQKAFDATHIKEINPQPGDKLDPHQHQAMQAVVSEQEPNTIVSVMKKRLYIGRPRAASCNGCCGEKRRLKASLDKVYQA